MPRRCTVCDSPARREIDKALIPGANRKYRDIAARYGLSLAALVRHRDDHLPASLLKAQAAREVAAALVGKGGLVTPTDRGHLDWLRAQGSEFTEVKS